MFAPAIVQQISFNKVHIQKGRKALAAWGYGAMLQRKSCCLLLCHFVGVVTVNTETLARFGVIDSSTVVCKAIFLHRAGNIALRRCFCFFQRLIVQLIVKAVFKMVISSDLIRRGHLCGVTVNGFCGQPLRFFRESIIQLPHFLDLRVDIACPQVLFTSPASAEEIITIGA